VGVNIVRTNIRV